MEQENEVVVRAGEILKILSPPTIGTLLFVIDERIEYQTEMADLLDCSASVVTTSLQSLEELPVPLVEKRGSKYSITSEGEEILDILDQSILHLGFDLCDINWGNDANKDRLGEELEPLHNSRSIRPFFVLSSISGRITLSEEPLTVQLADIVSDVRSLKENQEETVDRTQIQWTLGRFEESGVVEIDDETVTVTEKGEEHVRMFTRLVDFLDEIQSTSDENRVDSSSVNKQQEATETHRGTDEVQTIGPAYCLGSSAVDERYPVLPFEMTITVDELFKRIRNLRNEHDGDTELELSWAVWTDRQNADLPAN